MKTRGGGDAEMTADITADRNSFKILTVSKFTDINKRNAWQYDGVSSQRQCKKICGKSEKVSET